MKQHAALLCLLFAGLRFVSGESGCPEAEDILPCVCTNSPYTYLECKNIDDAESLKNVFANSARYTYKEVHIEYSTLQYLPSTLFESVPVKELHLTNVTLSTLFDKAPEALDELRKLHIENTVVLRGILWELLQPLKSLKIIEIYFNTIKTLGKDFSEHVPKEIEQISLYGTQTKTIQSGVFTDFPNLDKVAVDAGKLSELTRDILPVPFNGRVLYFNDNSLSEISDDMFSQMPNLQTLGLRNNQIATLPESAFQGTGDKLEYLMLTDNPIKCDCRIEWLVRRKPPALSGKCESPKRLHDKELRDVTTGDLNC